MTKQDKALWEIGLACLTKETEFDLLAPTYEKLAKNGDFGFDLSKEDLILFATRIGLPKGWQAVVNTIFKVDNEEKLKVTKKLIEGKRVIIFRSELDRAGILASSWYAQNPA